MQTKHNLIQGDCLEELKNITEESIDLIFADPPYGLAKKKGLGWKYSKHITLEETWDIFSKDEFFDFNIKWITESMRVLKHGGSFWVCGSFHNIYQLGFILQHLDFKINNSVVWFKPNAQPNITCRMFTESCEHLIWAVKNHSKTKWTFNYQDTKNKIEDQLNPRGKQTRNVWSIPLTPKKEKWAGEHPTQKPIELLRRIILASSKEKDLILDPFVGSGTTSVVAKMLNRNSIGIEKENKYLAIAKKRLSQSNLI
ncbi:site-specific DNA-methyltransferase [Candidatus Woesearchaeota archaeon]|nr:site-specific DNA-methyltransferase [Candidatus Woesearchaeota archaeon]MBI2661398.1 site-specific DNA-methyltransferase [Candidatus Woesearchaeota archaeon]